MMQATFEPNEPISLTMTAGEWQLIMQTLAEGRYNVVAPLIQKLQQQALESKGPMPAPNGEIRDASRV